jgi:MFS family permease
MGRLAGRRLGRQFEWLWAAYAVSSYGTGLGFGAFALIAIRVLHAGPAQVATLSAVGLAVGAVVAVPLGPWMEYRRKRPVMIAMDLARFTALATIPVAFAFGVLSFWQLLAVVVLVAAAKIAFNAASGAHLKSLVRPEDLIVANARFESTTWTSTVLGPPLGGAAIGILGPVTTVLADAVSYLLSAAGIRMIGGGEARPPRPADASAARFRLGDLIDGWRYILWHRELRLLFLNRLTFNGLVMATEPLLAVLMLGTLKFAPWQYSLAFAVPCTGGLIGSRLSPRLVNRFGQRRVMLAAGTLRSCWPVGLAFMGPGVAGLALCMAVEFGLIASIGVSNPVVTTYLLRQLPAMRVARALSAWSVSSTLAIAGLTALWGGLATITSPRVAIGIAGALLLATPLLLPGLLPSVASRAPRAFRPGRPSPARARRGDGGDDAAVDEQVDPAEEAGVVGQGEGHHRGDLLRQAHPGQRGRRQHHRDGRVLLRLLAALRRVDEAGRDRDHPRAQRAEADGLPLGEDLDPALGQRVRGARVLHVLAGGFLELVQEPVLQRVGQQLVELGVLWRRRAQHRGHRGEVHRGRARRSQRAQRLGQPRGADQVDLEDAPPVRHRRRDARRVRDRAQRAQLRHPGGEPAQGTKVGDVGDKRLHGNAGRRLR